MSAYCLACRGVYDVTRWPGSGQGHCVRLVWVVGVRSARRSLSRQLGPLMEMTSQWCRRRSRTAVARTSSVKTLPHSLKALLLVMMIDPFSYRWEMSWKTRLASARSRGR